MTDDVVLGWSKVCDCLLFSLVYSPVRSFRIPSSELLALSPDLVMLFVSSSYNISVMQQELVSLDVQCQHSGSLVSHG